MNVRRAALASIGRNGAVASAFVFPYAPETLHRSLDRGPAGITETLTITFNLDASDALNAGDATTGQFGLHPALARLQSLVAQPWLVLSWGPSRTLPIEPLGTTVSELAFDAALNPVRADVTLQARVLSSSTDPVATRFVEKAAATTSGLAHLYAPGAVPELS